MASTDIPHPLTCIIIGRSGSGKGTQVDLLQKTFTEWDPQRSQFYFDAGAHFRQFFKSGDSYTHRCAKQITERGGLQPSFMAIHMWAGAFIEHLGEDDHLIIDGSPRTKTEAEALHAALVDFYERPMPFIVEISVSKDEATRRLTGRGRSDDTEDAIAARVGWFDTVVKPAIANLEEREAYSHCQIDGEQSVEQVHEDIVSAIRGQL